LSNIKAEQYQMAWYCAELLLLKRISELPSSETRGSGGSLM